MFNYLMFLIGNDDRKGNEKTRITISTNNIQRPCFKDPLNIATYYNVTTDNPMPLKTLSKHF